MLQSVDNYINEQQPSSRCVRAENCYNTIIGSNDLEEKRTLYTKVVFDCDDFNCKITRDKVCLTFVNSEMFDKDKNIIRDFAPVFIVADSPGMFFIENLSDMARNTIQSLIYTNYILIPVHICADNVIPYGVSSGVNKCLTNFIGGKINMRSISGKYMFYYGEVFQWPWSIENIKRVQDAVGMDILSVDDRVVGATSVKHSIL